MILIRLDYAWSDEDERGGKDLVKKELEFRIRQNHFDQSDHPKKSRKYLKTQKDIF